MSSRMSRLFTGFVPLVKRLGRAAGLGGARLPLPVQASAPELRDAQVSGVPLRATAPVINQRRFWLISQLLGAPVENLDGERIGFIDNLILDTANGTILVALVFTTTEHGPAFHLEVPWRALINRGVDGPGTAFLVDLGLDEIRRQRAVLTASP